MIGARKTAANRANARASTGPRTAAGRRRVAQNARRHGLSIPVSADPIWSAEIENLAHAIAGDGASPEEHNLAVRIANAQMDIVRVRRARHNLLARALSNIADLSSRNLDKTLGDLRIPNSDDEDRGNNLPSEFTDVLCSLGPEQFATILVDYTEKLAALDRYERRGRSRRKFAIRDFDIARQAAADAKPKRPV